MVVDCVCATSAEPDRLRAEWPRTPPNSPTAAHCRQPPPVPVAGPRSCDSIAVLVPRPTWFSLPDDSLRFPSGPDTPEATGGPVYSGQWLTDKRSGDRTSECAAYGDTAPEPPLTNGAVAARLRFARAPGSPLCSAMG